MSDNSDEINLADLVKKFRKVLTFLVSKWILIVTCAITLGVLAFIWSSRMPIHYAGKITFLVENGRSGGSALSAISGQFGIELPSSSGREMFAGDNMIGLLKSKKISREVLLSPYRGNGTLADEYADVYGLRKSWKKNEKIGVEVFFPINPPYSRLQDSLLQTIQEQLSEALIVSRTDKKMSFFSVSISLKDEQLTKAYVERIVNKAVDFYILTKTERQRMNVARLERRADSIGNILTRRTYASAVEKSSILDINPAYQTALVGAETSERNKGMFAMIYAEILGNLEAHKASLTQETPVIQMIDEAILPLKIEKANVMKLTILGLIFGIFLSSALLISIRLIKRYWSNRANKTVLTKSSQITL